MLAHIKTIPESFMENYCLINLGMKIHIKCVEKIKSMFSRIVAAVNTNEMALCKKKKYLHRNENLSSYNSTSKEGGAKKYQNGRYF